MDCRGRTGGTWVFGNAHCTPVLAARARNRVRKDKKLGPTLADKGSAHCLGSKSFVPTRRGHSFMGADNTGTGDLYRLLVLTKAELRRSCERIVFWNKV